MLQYFDYNQTHTYSFIIVVRIKIRINNIIIHEYIYINNMKNIKNKKVIEFFFSLKKYIFQEKSICAA